MTVFFGLLGAGAIVFGSRITELDVLRDPIGARAFAYLIGSLILGFSAIQAARQVVAIRRGDTTDVPRGDDPHHPASVGRTLTIILLVPVYAWSMQHLSFIIATSVFMSVCLWLMEVRSRGRLVVYPIVFSIVTFVLFRTLMHVRLPMGPLEGLLVWAGLS